jgi:hypothetical protein
MQDISDNRLTVKPAHIPQGINAEVLWNVYPEDTFYVKFCGLHKRNAYNDILEIEQYQDKLLLHLSRNSLYNALPEYLFHSIDRFDHIIGRDKKEKFDEEYAKQEQEKEQAYRFFAPIDTQLFHLRLQVREKLCQYAESNIVIQNILLDKLSKEQKGNRFIKRTIPYIPSCKSIRGNRTLITLMLRKVFMDEDIIIRIQTKQKEFTDEHPRYKDTEGNILGEVYTGNTFSESVISYSISYWSDDECDSNFLSFVDDLEEYRQFVQDYFLSVDSILEFDISKDVPPLRISDTTLYNYLNYNTNI